MAAEAAHMNTDKDVLRTAAEIADSALAPLRAKFADLAAVALNAIHPTLLEISRRRESLDVELERWAADW